MTDIEPFRIARIIALEEENDRLRQELKMPYGRQPVNNTEYISTSNPAEILDKYNKDMADAWDKVTDCFSNLSEALEQAELCQYNYVDKLLDREIEK